MPSVLRAGDTAALGEEFRQLLSNGQLGGMKIGLIVQALSGEDEVIFSREAQKAFKPASNMKIVTTAAAVSVLPRDFTYRTILACRGEDLLIIGSGDPSIGDPRFAKRADESVTAIFHQWAEKLKAMGITEITGKLLFDDFVFEQQHIHPSWKDQHNLQSWYAAPVGGLNFHDNCVDVAIKPAAQKGQSAEVRLIPNTTYTKLVNKTKTSSKGEPLILRSGDDPMTIYVKRRVSRPNTSSPFSLTVVDPGAFFAATARTVFATEGIKIHGKTQRQRIRRMDGSLPDNLQIVAEHRTRMRDILWRVNKCSQNMFAEALLKTMGAYAGRVDNPREGSWETGRKAIEGFLKHVGAELEKIVVDDGSGLSHDNRMTPQAMMDVLAYMHSRPDFKEWLTSLAVPGEEVGTLRRRMKDLAGQVFAKTGYIRGASVLSGYVLPSDDQKYAFTVLCNDTYKAKGGTWAAKKLQESVCETLAETKETARGG
jgi:D-alanyl-D-alanine carboxypeptidase/D-alanyl-D-alanine-endopeptidase (penicillin-binding protein 4)